MPLPDRRRLLSIARFVEARFRAGYLDIGRRFPGDTARIRLFQKVDRFKSFFARIAQTPSTFCCQTPSKPPWTLFV
jgi:hypothetical protein